MRSFYFGPKLKRKKKYVNQSKTEDEAKAKVEAENAGANEAIKFRHIKENKPKIILWNLRIQ